MKVCRHRVLLKVIVPIIHATFKKPVSPILECEVYNTFSYKELYSLYATEKSRLAQNSQALFKPKPSQNIGSQNPSTRVMRIYL